MVRAIIIEDEPDQLEGMMRLLEKYCPEVTVVASAADKKNGIEAILEFQPDLVFLDIRLMGHDTAGFEILEAVRFMDFELVFLSSRTELALQAVNLERHVCYFLEKPVQINAAVLAVKKAMELIQLKTAANETAASTKERLAVPRDHGLDLLWIKDIIHCKAETWLTKVYLVNRTNPLAVSKNLGWFCRILPTDKFVRSHNSHLVNLDFVVDYDTKEGANLTLKSGEKIPVGPAFKEELLKKMHQL